MEQGFPGYPIWKSSDILNHNILHVHNVQISDIPIVERGKIQALLMYEIVDTSTSRSAGVAFAAAIKQKMIEKTVIEVMRDT